MGAIFFFNIRYRSRPIAFWRRRLKTAQEVGLLCENFVVGFKVGARRVGPRAAALHLYNDLPIVWDLERSFWVLGSVCVWIL